MNSRTALNKQSYMTNILSLCRGDHNKYSGVEKTHALTHKFNTYPRKKPLGLFPSLSIQDFALDLKEKGSDLKSVSGETDP